MIPDSTVFFTEDFAKWYLDIKRTLMQVELFLGMLCNL